MSRKKLYYGLYALGSVAYLSATLLGPLSPTRFNLTAYKTHLLQVSIAIPVILIYGIAVYAAERFKGYASSIKGHKDGEAMDNVATGLGILAFSLIANGVIGTLRPWAMRDGWLPSLVIFSNYIAAWLPLAAYIYLFKGSYCLRSLVKNSNEKRYDWWGVGTLIAVIATVYSLIVLNYDYRSTTPDPKTYSSFFLPTIAIFMTIMLPYLLAWLMAFKAALNILIYTKEVKGVIYRSALSRLALGILIIILFTISLQFLISLSAYFARAGLSTILVIVYLIIIFYAIGFIVMASGTRKLDKIEKVR